MSFSTVFHFYFSTLYAGPIPQWWSSYFFMCEALGLILSTTSCFVSITGVIPDSRGRINPEHSQLWSQNKNCWEISESLCCVGWICLYVHKLDDKIIYKIKKWQIPICVNIICKIKVYSKTSEKGQRDSTLGKSCLAFALHVVNLVLISVLHIFFWVLPGMSQE